MELKFLCLIQESQFMAGFNRTFMELKYANVIDETIKFNVLIVPLWN